MIGSFQTGVSGLNQFQQDLEVIGNNIANVNTVGYKGARMEFADALSQSLVNGSTQMQVGTGVSTSAINTFFNAGTLNNTGITTDLAVLSGTSKGFFVIKDPSNGANYVTRDGEFHLDGSKFLTTNAGMRVQGYTGAGPYTAASPIGDIQIDDASAITALGAGALVPAPTITLYSIDSSGQIHAQLDNGVTTVSGVMGQVVLQDFSNPQALIKTGANLYSYSAVAGPLAVPGAPGTGGLGGIVSGGLESSNVDLGNEMSNLITAQRAFEANAKIVTTSDEILQVLVNIKR
jgi:flagellar hook protein FlgE